MALRTCAGGGHWYTSPPRRRRRRLRLVRRAPRYERQGHGSSRARLARYAALRSSGEPGCRSRRLRRFCLRSRIKLPGSKIGHAMLCLCGAPCCAPRATPRALCRRPAPARRALCAAPAPAPAVLRVVGEPLVSRPRAARGLTPRPARARSPRSSASSRRTSAGATLSPGERDALFREAGARGRRRRRPALSPSARRGRARARAPPLSFRDLRARRSWRLRVGARATFALYADARDALSRGRALSGMKLRASPFPSPPSPPPPFLRYADATGRMGRAEFDRAPHKLIDAALGCSAARRERGEAQQHGPPRWRALDRAAAARSARSTRTATARSTRASSPPRCCSCARPRRASGEGSPPPRAPFRSSTGRPRGRRQRSSGWSPRRAPRAARRRRPRAVWAVRPVRTRAPAAPARALAAAARRRRPRRAPLARDSTIAGSCARGAARGWLRPVPPPFKASCACTRSSAAWRARCRGGPPAAARPPPGRAGGAAARGRAAALARRGRRGGRGGEARSEGGRRGAEEAVRRAARATPRSRSGVDGGMGLCVGRGRRGGAGRGGRARRAARVSRRRSSGPRGAPRAARAEGGRALEGGTARGFSRRPPLVVDGENQNPRGGRAGRVAR